MRISDWSSDVCSSDLQPHQRIAKVDLDLVGADGRIGVADAARPETAFVEAKEADHVVLVDAVARDADAANQLRATIDGHGAGEDLDAGFQRVLPWRHVGRLGAAPRRVGAVTQAVGGMGPAVST